MASKKSVDCLYASLHRGLAADHSCTKHDAQSMTKQDWWDQIAEASLHIMLRIDTALLMLRCMSSLSSPLWQQLHSKTTVQTERTENHVASEPKTPQYQASCVYTLRRQHSLPSMTLHLFKAELYGHKKAFWQSTTSLNLLM